MSSIDRFKGKWRVRWYADGIQIARYFTDEYEARCFAASLQPKKKKMYLNLGELIDSYLMANPDKNFETRLKISRFIHVGSGQFLEEKEAETLSRQDLEEMRTRLKKKGCSNNTINKYQAYIRAILAWGVENQLIKTNPWASFKRLKTVKFNFKASFDDFKKILSVAPDWLHWALLTCYNLSLRPGHKELFSLEWTAFKWRYGYVLVPHQGKSDRPKKVIPPQSYLNKARTRYDKDRLQGIILVCHRNGQPVRSYRTAWLKALKDAGLEGSGIRFYDIRHISATEMLANGADLAAVSAQLGHSNTHTTAMTYVHVLPEAQIRAATLLPDLETDN